MGINPALLKDTEMTQPLDREIDELIHTAFDDPGYVDVHWNLSSIVTDLQSEDKTFYQGPDSIEKLL